MNFPIKDTGATYNKLYCKRPLKVDHSQFYGEIYDTFAGIVLSINPKSACYNNKEDMTKFANVMISLFYKSIHEEQTT